VSKKFTRMALDEVSEFMTSENRPSFPQQTLAFRHKRSFWSCNLPRERYNCTDSEPKKEIPVNAKYLVV
jgi:hypothetical protein